MTRLGATQRFASADSIKATARLERFWRTLRDSAGLYRLGLPLDRADLERRLEVALTFYVCFRPHEGLSGATPAEVDTICHQDGTQLLGAEGHLGLTSAPLLHYGMEVLETALDHKGR